MTFFSPIVSCCRIIFNDFSILINHRSPTLVTCLQGTCFLFIWYIFSSLIPVVSNIKCFCLSLVASDGNFIKTVSVRFAEFFSSPEKLQDFFFPSTKMFAGKGFFCSHRRLLQSQNKEMLLLNVGTG